MAKLMSVRVTIAADSPVTLEVLKPKLAAIIAAAGTEALPDQEGARIHWGTAEVIQGADRAPAPTKRGKRATGQSELAP